MDFAETVELVGKTIDAVGVAVIVLGALVATGRLARGRHGEGDRYRAYRKDLGRGILLGLEFLVAADIIRTVAVSPTFTSVGVLAGIVLIRTFLSFSLELEISGHFPWSQPHPADVKAAAEEK
jgi:uncharacterized membrane protein